MIVCPTVFRGCVRTDKGHCNVPRLSMRASQAEAKCSSLGWGTKHCWRCQRRQKPDVVEDDIEGQEASVERCRQVRLRRAHAMFQE